MARAPMHIYAGAAPRPQPHPCPFCRDEIAAARTACTRCEMNLPLPLRTALRAAWDEGRGAESAEFAVAIGAAESHLAKAGGAL